MAATAVTGKPNASGASSNAVASTNARLAVLVATRCGRSVPHGREPGGVPSRRSGARRHQLEGWRELTVEYAGGQRKVVLAREVRRIPTPCGRT